MKPSYCMTAGLICFIIAMIVYFVSSLLPFITGVAFSFGLSDIRNHIIYVAVYSSFVGLGIVLFLIGTIHLVEMIESKLSK